MRSPVPVCWWHAVGATSMLTDVGAKENSHQGVSCPGGRQPGRACPSGNRKDGTVCKVRTVLPSVREPNCRPVGQLEPQQEEVSTAPASEHKQGACWVGGVAAGARRRLLCLRPRGREAHRAGRPALTGPEAAGCSQRVEPHHCGEGLAPPPPRAKPGGQGGAGHLAVPPGLMRTLGLGRARGKPSSQGGVRILWAQPCRGLLSVEKEQDPENPRTRTRGLRLDQGLREPLPCPESRLAASASEEAWGGPRLQGGGQER